jgi:hypothetical protein
MRLNSGLAATGEPLHVLILAGSARRWSKGSDADSRSATLMRRMADGLPYGWDIDAEDLSAAGRIQGCNGCSRRSAALCCWPCNCYAANDAEAPDAMWDRDLYGRLDLADAWAVIGPARWYAPATNLKLMFDRLACMNGGNPRPDLIDQKDPEKARRLEAWPEWQDLSRNHLEGRAVGFFCYGEEEEAGGPRPRRGDPAKESFGEGRDTYAPLVWQCRHAGLEAPDDLWRHAEFGKGKGCSDEEALRRFDAWVVAFAVFVASRGKVQPGPYRACGRAPVRPWWMDLPLARPGSQG